MTEMLGAAAELGYGGWAAALLTGAGAEGAGPEGAGPEATGLTEAGPLGAAPLVAGAEPPAAEVVMAGAGASELASGATEETAGAAVALCLRAGQLVTVGAHEVMVTSSVW